MMRQTGADGVVVGRGCLGRPWLFRDLADAFAGPPARPAPALGEVGATLVDHARAAGRRCGASEAGLRDLRKHTGWYLTGYPVGGDVRRALATVDSLGAAGTAIVAAFDPDLAPPTSWPSGPRGTQSGPAAGDAARRLGATDRDDTAPPPPPAAARPRAVGG